MQEIAKELEAAQHLRQAAENELLHLKWKAAKVAGKLEMTGDFQICTVVEYYSRHASKHAHSCIALEALQLISHFGCQSST